MPAVEEISESLVRENIVRAVSDVFKTMLNRQFKLTDFAGQGQTHAPAEIVAKVATPQVVGTVGFIGDINGLIYLYLPVPFARMVTCHLLGMTEPELDEAGDEVINDAIGELTNMTVGSFKNGLCDAGYPCKLTIPSILRGSNFCIEPISSAQRFIYSFKDAEHVIVTDILLKAGD